jgi:hypothetical protein
MATSGKLCRITADALGVSFETTREHLRNIRREGKISFAGYGRGAAPMTARDAARLLLAVAGSYFVKDSLATMTGFGKLESVGAGKPMQGGTGEELVPRARLQDYLASEIERLRDAVATGTLPQLYTRPSKKDEWQRIRTLAVTLVTAAGSEDIPRYAIVRRFSDTTSRVFPVAFAPPKWPERAIGATGYVLHVRNVGLVQERHICAWSLAEIAAVL